jgi:hypothetical protein
MNTRYRVPGLVSQAAVIWALAAGIAFAATTPTPTPKPKLSGGFGRPRATPAPRPEGNAAESEPVRPAPAASGQKTEKSTLTIDNRSLVTNPEKGRVSTSRIAAAPTPHPPAAGAAGTSSPVAADGSLTGGSEAEWRETARKARKRVEDGKLRVEELGAAVKKLENDFYAWDDGQYRDRVIKPSWDRTRAELDSAKLELASAEKDLADLPEKARKAGAYPGWIRQ